jgi:hypothetical protein
MLQKVDTVYNMFTGPNIITDGLVLYLDAANTKSYSGSGTTWGDVSRNSNNGTLINGPTFDSSNVGSIVFDGVNDYAEITNTPILQITGDQTLEFFVYPKRRDIRQNWYDKAYGGEGTITYESNGSLNYYWGTAGSNTTPYQGFGTVGTPLEILNTWYHVVLVRELSTPTRTLKWYINGILNNTAAASYTAATASLFNIRIALGYTTYFQGNIQTVRIYNKALSPIEILQNYNSTKGRFNL